MVQMKSRCAITRRKATTQHETRSVAEHQEHLSTAQEIVLRHHPTESDDATRHQLVTGEKLPDHQE
jgi:hypothetical protein